MNSGFVDTVDSICVKIEQEARRKLFTSAEQATHIVKANLYELSRGDMKNRSEYWHKMLQNGVVSVNEVREAEGFIKIQAGDVYYRPLNMSFVDAAGQLVFNASDNSTEPMERKEPS